MPEDDGRINGVNLGGWLVLERWMTPGLFRASGEEDEIWLHRSTDPAELERLLRRHRDTYITEDDFRAILRARAEPCAHPRAVFHLR